MKLCHLQENGWNWVEIMLSEIGQAQKAKHHLFVLIYGV
jgi:hypothetical protein